MNVPILDKCPGFNLYIGGVITLRRPRSLQKCNITHIVSVLDWKFDDDSALLQGYQHLHIPVDDVEDENLLEWFPQTIAFIKQGLGPGHLGDTARVAMTRTASTTDATATVSGSGVLIHCAMGKSRSATILLAYLLWATRQAKDQGNINNRQPTAESDMVAIPRRPLSVIEALQILRQGRPIAEPNEGFMDQLHMFEAMGCPSTEIELKRHKIYRRWMNKRSVEESLRINQAPEMANIIFEDEPDSDLEPEHAKGVSTALTKDRSATQTRLTGKKEHMEPVAPGLSAPDGTLPSAISPSNPLALPAQSPGSSQPQTTVKCRKCRHILATTPFILPHDPPPHRDPNSHMTTRTTTKIVSSDSQTHSNVQCAHVFLHPLSWMRDILSQGTMEGRLSCPNKKCGANVGKFAWTGLRCSCGGWVTPGFGLIRGKVDEFVTRSRGSGHALDNDAINNGSGLRLPPGMAKRGNL